MNLNTHMGEEGWQHLYGFICLKIFEFKKDYLNFPSAFTCTTMIIWIMEVPTNSAMNKIFFLLDTV